MMRETRDVNVQVWPAVGVRRTWPPKYVKDDAMFERVAYPTGEAPG